MKVWVDACTGKQVRYSCAIASRFRRLGYQLVLTTREHPDTIALADTLGEKFTVVGRYDPTSLFTRLQESVKRTLLFCEMFKNDLPNLAISHKSVEQSRVAYGLKVPIILTDDSPHAEAVNRLTLLLANVMVVPRAIPQHHYWNYGVRRVVQFDGVDEVAWIKGYKPKLIVENYRKPLIVVRQMETMAAYAEGKTDVTEEIARKLTSLGQVVFLPRYDRRRKEGLVVPQGFVDCVSLVANADLVVSAGGTIAREAALQGTPSVVVPILGPSLINDYLSKLGFPLFTVDLPKLLRYAKKYLGLKRDVKEMLDKLENPVDVIEKIIEEKGYAK